MIFTSVHETVSNLVKFKRTEAVVWRGEASIMELLAVVNWGYVLYWYFLGFIPGLFTMRTL